MDYTVIDLEMTGLSAKTDRIIEIGAVRVRAGEVTDTYSTLVNPKRPIPAEVTELTGITEEMAARGAEEEEAMRALLEFIGEDVLVGHNVTFDYRFLKQWAVNNQLDLHMTAHDTLRLARALLPDGQSKRLEDLCVYFEIPREHAHRALDDALETQRIFERLIPVAQEKAPELLEPHKLVFHTKRQIPATARQIERLKELRAQYGIEDDICWETLTKGAASRLWDQYYSRVNSP